MNVYCYCCFNGHIMLNIVQKSNITGLAIPLKYKSLLCLKGGTFARWRLIRVVQAKCLIALKANETTCKNYNKSKFYANALYLFL